MLTEKQKANRIYYARHSEEIKAQKRELYWKGSNRKPEKKPPPPVAVPEKQKAANPKTTQPALTRSMVNAEAKKKLEVRRRIEDRLLAKELDLETF